MIFPFGCSFDHCLKNLELVIQRGQACIELGEMSFHGSRGHSIGAPYFLINT